MVQKGSGPRLNIASVWHFHNEPLHNEPSHILCSTPHTVW